MVDKLIHIKCDICGRQHPAHIDLFRLCSQDEKKICFRCWVTKDNGAVLCPSCSAELRTISDEEMEKLAKDEVVKSVQDNHHPLPGQVMHMSFDCVPKMAPLRQRSLYSELKRLTEKGVPKSKSTLFGKLLGEDSNTDINADDLDEDSSTNKS